MSDFPFDIPTVQPSSGGGGLPHSAILTESTETITSVPNNAVGKVIPSFELFITPTSTTQKVYLSGVINGEFSHLPRFGNVIIYRDTTSLAPDNGEGSTRQVNGQFLINFGRVIDDNVTPETCPFSYVDTPNTTEEIKYQIYLTNIQPSGYTVSFYLNRTVNGTDNYVKRLASSFSAQCFEP